MNNVKLIMTFLLFFSCSNINSEAKNSRNLNSDTMIELSQVTKSNQQINDFENFGAFWNEFGQSLKSNDTLALINLSLPEIDVGTIDDSDETFTFKGKEVAQIILFEYQNGGYYDYEKDKDVSNIEMIDLPLVELLDYRKDSDGQRINNFVFSKSKGGWKLTGLYTKIENYFTDHPRK